MIEKLSEGAPEVAQHFMTQRPCRNKVLVSKFQVLTDTAECQEILFPQHKRPWHLRWDSSAGNHFMLSRQLVWDMFHNADPKIDVYGRALYGTNRYGHSNEPIGWNYEALHSPAYFKIMLRPRSNRIICDYAHAAYQHDEGSRYPNLNKIRVRIWSHIEYDWIKREQRHVISAPKSWTCVGWNKDNIGTVRMDHSFAVGAQSTFSRQDSLVSVFPWMHFNVYNTKQVGMWYIDFLARVKTFLSAHFKILPDLVDKDGDCWEKVSLRDLSKQLHVPHHGSVLAGNLIANRSFHSYFTTRIPSLKNAPPSYFKYALACFRLQVQDADITKIAPDDGLPRRINFIFRLANMLEDPSFLQHIPPSALIELREGDAQLTDPVDHTSMVYVCNDEFFQKFPRSKQYKFFAELCLSSEFHNRADGIRMWIYIRDLVSMLQKIHAHQEGGVGAIAEVVDTKDVKNWKDFHDKATQVFNNIRYKPIRINPSLFEFLTEYGLDIPDTSLTIRIPEHTNIIREWGTEQGHCIGSYADQCANLTTLLMGVWDNNLATWFGHIQADPAPRYILQAKKQKPQKILYNGNGYERRQPFNRYAENPYIYNNNAVPNYTYTATISTGQKPKIYIRQFYGKHNGGLPQDLKAKVAAHLNAAVEAMWEKQKKVMEEEQKSKERLDEALRITDALENREKHSLVS